MLKNCLMFFASSFAKSVLTANFYRALELYKKTEKIVIKSVTCFAHVSFMSRS